MKTASEDIKSILNGHSFTVDGETITFTYGTNLYIAKEPQRPADTITIFDAPGGGIPFQMDETEQHEIGSVQIRIRNTDYIKAMAMAYEIVSVLNGRGNEVIESTYYMYIKCSMGPALLDYDNNSRPRIFINFELKRRF